MQRAVVAVVTSLFVVAGIAVVGLPAGGQGETDPPDGGADPGEFSDPSADIDLIQRLGPGATGTASETGASDVPIPDRARTNPGWNVTNGTETDDDGLSTSVTNATNGTDTEDDVLPDAVENTRGTDPTDSDSDSDDDGLPDARELDVGTDPTDPDTDGDRLLDGWEVKGETPSGAPLPDSDPLAKDLYVQVDYARGVERPESEFYVGVVEAFDAMAVENPDNSTGIDLHVREGGPINDSSRFDGENFWSLKDAYYEQRLGPRAGTYHHVVVSEFGTDYAGYGEVGGKFSMVAAGVDTDTRRHVVVHELLHNVVGDVEGPGACHGGRHYCDGGWLSPEITPEQGGFLSGPVATQLEEQGFADE